MPPYTLDDITQSYRWLGHKAFTELNAFHRDYQHGKENLEWNATHNLLPKIWYARSEKEVVRFVQRFHPYRMLCYSINPRPQIFRNPKGFARSARESEIEISQNLLLDIDIASKQISNEQLTALEAFLQTTEQYFLDLHLKTPVKAYTGRGYHLLLAFPEINVRDCPDIAARLKRFSEQFREAYRQELANLDAKLDSTQDLRRMVKIYGTAKPTVGIISRFYGGERIEDEGLRAYLLEMKLAEPQLGSFVLSVSIALPEWFPKLLETDSRISELWSGAGKIEGTDTTRSGYDYSLVKRLLNLGYKNIDDLATILALRPEGSFQKSRKREEYIRRTIANALLK